MMVTNQAYLFCIFIINGIIIGILFDFFRILRKTFNTSDLITYIEDSLFWILTGIIILYSIFVFNNGEIRFFIFFGIILGVFLYMLLFSSYIIKINVKIINFIKKIVSKIIEFLLLPIKYFYKIIKKLFFRPVSFVIINITKSSTKLWKKTTKILERNKTIKNNVKN